MGGSEEGPFGASYHCDWSSIGWESSSASSMCSYSSAPGGIAAKCETRFRQALSFAILSRRQQPHCSCAHLLLGEVTSQLRKRKTTRSNRQQFKRAITYLRHPVKCLPFLIQIWTYSVSTRSRPRRKNRCPNSHNYRQIGLEHLIDCI